MNKNTSDLSICEYPTERLHAWVANSSGVASPRSVVDWDTERHVFFNNWHIFKAFSGQPLCKTKCQYMQKVVNNIQGIAKDSKLQNKRSSIWFTTLYCIQYLFENK